MNIKSVLISEPERVDRFYPFSVMHPLWELRLGSSMLFEKLKYLIPDCELFFHCEKVKLDSFLQRNNIREQKLPKAGTLVWDSSVMPSRTLLDEIRAAYNLHKKSGGNKSIIFTHAARPFAAFIPEDEMINPSERDIAFLPRFLNDFLPVVPTLEIQRIRRIDDLWSTLDFTAGAVREDYIYIKDKFTQFDSGNFPGAWAVNPESILLGEGVLIAPGVVIDASDGPVILCDNVRIMPNATIIGPTAIGDNSTIKTGAKIYENTAIGPWCKVGGEVEDSIIQGYSNKQHDGFLGHSWLGEWVNLGADTNNSDLKNTYGNISIRLRGETIDTGRMFLGFLCGDHTKTAINTQINTGTVAGISAMIASAGFPDKEIHSFGWIAGESAERYDFGKALQVARRVMRRRNRTLTDPEEELMKREFNINHRNSL